MILTYKIDIHETVELTKGKGTGSKLKVKYTIVEKKLLSINH